MRAGRPRRPRNAGGDANVAARVSALSICRWGWAFGTPARFSTRRYVSGVKTRAVAALVAVLLLGWAQARAAPHGRVLYGYSYAQRCPAGGIADVVDRWGMYECNCTSYVAWALQVNGQRIDWFIRGAMDAWNWPHVASLAGIAVGTRPRVGAVAVWPKLEPPFGHTAYVSSVERNGDFDVAEYNYRPATGFEPFVFDIRRGISPHGATFIYVPPRD